MSKRQLGERYETTVTVPDGDYEITLGLIWDDYPGDGAGWELNYIRLPESLEQRLFELATLEADGKETRVLSRAYRGGYDAARAAAIEECAQVVERTPTAMFPQVLEPDIDATIHNIADAIRALPGAKQP